MSNRVLREHKIYCQNFGCFCISLLFFFSLVLNLVKEKWCHILCCTNQDSVTFDQNLIIAGGLFGLCQTNLIKPHSPDEADSWEILCFQGLWSRCTSNPEHRNQNFKQPRSDRHHQCIKKHRPLRFTWQKHWTWLNFCRKTMQRDNALHWSVN